MICCNQSLMTLALFLEAIMLNAFSVRWLDRDETKIKYTDEFESADYVLKIDILEDAIADLQIKHDKLMMDEEKRWENKKRGHLYVAK